MNMFWFLQSLEDLEDQKRRKKKEKMGLSSLSRVFARGKQRKSLDPGLFDGTNTPEYYIEEDADWWSSHTASLTSVCLCVFVCASEIVSLWPYEVCVCVSSHCCWLQKHKFRSTNSDQSCSAPALHLLTFSSFIYTESCCTFSGNLKGPAGFVNNKVHCSTSCACNCLVRNAFRLI